MASGNSRVEGTWTLNPPPLRGQECTDFLRKSYVSELPDGWHGWRARTRPPSPSLASAPAPDIAPARALPWLSWLARARPTAVAVSLASAPAPDIAPARALPWLAWLARARPTAVAVSLTSAPAPDIAAACALPCLVWLARAHPTTVAVSLTNMYITIPLQKIPQTKAICTPYILIS